MTISRYLIKVEGIVQGVGFRPFIYTLAVSLNLKGFVNNNSQGVFIDLEGKEEDLTTFLKKLMENPPPLAKIEKMNYEVSNPMNYSSFSINESEKLNDNFTLISPDIATCLDCIEDIHSTSNRRYKYPFTNCTNCGPRFSIIKTTPYDRNNTTMNKFQMCDLCNDEYIDPSNRRFHAQPNACDLCGPHVWVTDFNGDKVETLDPIKWTAEALNNGKIFAIKGLGGFHLVCDARNISAVEQLRRRKQRPHKPFAVMAKDIDLVKKCCVVNKQEEAILTGTIKPIVILNRSDTHFLPEAIAPNQKNIGVMLPFTPLQEILFQYGPDLLIMTSGNMNSLPLEYDNESALNNLSGIVDFFLINDRDICIPVDDSVVRIVKDEVKIIRRARGFAPAPMKYETDKAILAYGSNMKNTFCISKDNYIFSSQHNGDLENFETLENYKRNIEHFKNIFKFQPEAIACDLHPDYNSTKYAKELNLPLVEVQHHHAHIVSCMMENNIDAPVIGIAFDGTGYGTDGAIWGGEFLLTSIAGFHRFAHLDYVSLPGGETAIKEPWRMAVSYLNYAFKDDPNLKNILVQRFGEKALAVNSMIDSKINCTNTSSMGRFFDAVAAILDIQTIVSYEGQAAIELEAVIDEKITDCYEFEVIQLETECIIKTSKIIQGLLEDLKQNIPIGRISAKFHNTIINFSVDICILIRNTVDFNTVAISGGVFQNTYLYLKLLEKLAENNFIVCTNKDFPTNDGGVSLGQIAIANEMLYEEVYL